MTKRDKLILGGWLQAVFQMKKGMTLGEKPKTKEEIEAAKKAKAKKKKTLGQK